MLSPVVWLLVRFFDECCGGRGVRGVAGGDGGVGDQLRVGAHRDVALVAVEASRGALAAVAGVGVCGGYDPVLSDAARDAHLVVGARLEVLARNGGQQLGRVGRVGAEGPAPHRLKHRRGVLGELCHQRPARRGVLPVAHSLAARGVVVVSAQHRPQPRPEARRVRRGERLADRAAQHRDSVPAGLGADPSGGCPTAPPWRALNASTGRN